MSNPYTPTEPGKRIASGEKLVLGALIGTVGNHSGAWRRPTSRVEEITRLSLFKDVVQQAEAARIHAVFLADTVRLEPGSLRSNPIGHLEPLTLLSALSVVTEHIGLIGSVSTSFTEPYNAARQLASLDHLSGGRAGWNLITSAYGEENFGIDLLPHAERYDRGAEFAQVLFELWDSWAPDAIIGDRTRGEYADPSKVRRIDHQGTYFDVRGPLNVPRPPQGRPIVAQAGSSRDGQSVGGRYADLIFTTGRTTEADSIDFYRAVKAHAVAAGRHPEELKVLPGISPIIGQTETEAKAIERELNGFIDIESGRARLSRQLADAPLDDLDLDRPIPPERLPDPAAFEGRRSRYEVYLDLIEEGWTLRRLIEWEVSSSGHFVPVGSAEQIADLLVARFESGAADGAMLLPSYLPEGLTAITDLLVPILQERGAFQTEYAGSTLRENLGLGTPATLVHA